MRSLLTVSIVVASLSAQHVHFESVRQAFVPFPPASTMPGDFDGDGDVDLLSIELQAIQVLANDGEGRFHAPPTSRLAVPSLTALSFLSELVSGDLDGDGDLDVVLAGGSWQPLQPPLRFVLINDGAGHFTEQVATRWLIPPTDPITGMVLADQDGDGDLDLIVACSGTQADPPNNGTSRIYRNNGSGVLQATSVLPNPVGRFTAVAARDFDGDGDVDILLADGVWPNPPLRLYTNVGGGVLQQGTVPNAPTGCYLLLPLDADGDGDADVLCATLTQHRLLLNQGGTFAPGGALPAGFYPTDADVGDVDGDGDLDVLAIGYRGSRWATSPQLWRNQGGGLFVDATVGRTDHLGRRGAPWLRDLDGDGDLDCADGDVFFQDTGGRFVRCLDPDYPASDLERTTARHVAADLDGDGAAEIVRWGRDQTNGSRRIELLRNDGRGRMTAVATALSSAGQDGNQILLADLDGDGDRDVLFVAIGQNLLWRNDGGLAFTDVTSARLPADVAINNAAAAGDLDGDGDADLMLARGDWFLGAQDRLLRQQNGVFVDDTAASLPPENAGTHRLRFCDVDGDGDLDVIAADQSATAGSIRLLRNQGGGVFADATAGNIPPLSSQYGVFRLDAADLDGDGDRDLVVSDPWPHAWRNDGSGRFLDVTAAVLSPAVQLGYGGELVDFDVDGDVDLLLRGVPPAAAVNDGTGSFQLQPLGFVGVSTDGSFVDVDGDGDPDLAGPEDLLRNLNHQVLVTIPPRLGRHGEIDFAARPGSAVFAQSVVVAIGPLAAAPLGIPGLGRLQLDPQAVVAHSTLAIPVPGGRRTVRFLTPNQPALLGATLGVQALFALHAPVPRFLLSNAVVLEVRL